MSNEPSKIEVKEEAVEDEVLFDTSAPEPSFSIDPTFEDQAALAQERRSNRKRKSSLIVTLCNEAIQHKEKEKEPIKKKVKEEVLVKEE